MLKHQPITKLKIFSKENAGIWYSRIYFFSQTFCAHGVGYRFLHQTHYSFINSAVFIRG